MEAERYGSGAMLAYWWFWKRLACGIVALVPEHGAGVMRQRGCVEVYQPWDELVAQIGCALRTR